VSARAGTLDSSSVPKWLAMSSRNISLAKARFRTEKYRAWEADRPFKFFLKFLKTIDCTSR
jgi:hypothetical protein